MIFCLLAHHSHIFKNIGSDVKRAAEECSEAAELGADEVDVVFPFSALKDGDEAVGAELVGTILSFPLNFVSKVNYLFCALRQRHSLPGSAF